MSRDSVAFQRRTSALTYTAVVTLVKGSVDSSDHGTLRAEVACMAKQAKGVEEAMHHGDATEHHDVAPFVVEGRDIDVVVVLSHVPQPVVAHNGEDNCSHPCPWIT
jgi:hypothetical protein